MLAIERQRRILRILEEEVSVSIRRLKTEFKVTPMTLWRDLSQREDKGMLKRTRGGAMRIDVEKEPGFEPKMVQAAAAKQRIAQYAAAHFIREGDILTIEGGTTAACLVDFLHFRKLTVLTNSVPLTEKLRHQGEPFAAHCSGGLLRNASGTLVGNEAIRFFSNKKAHTCFISATGFTPDAGLTDPNPMEIEVKRAMLQISNRVILLLDSSKFGIQSLMEVVPLRRIHFMITEAPPPPAIQQLLDQHQVQVHCVP
jgi:DeoR family transcriptional regulator, fructose operon transcriptional repressor